MTRSQRAVCAVAIGLVLASDALVAQGVKKSSHPDPWFGIDKVKHFFMSAFINSVSYSVLEAARVNHRSAMAGAAGITMALGIGRELHDMRVPGNLFSVRDLTWDAIGTAAGAALTAHTIR